MIKLVVSPRTEDDATGATEIKEAMAGDKMELSTILDLTLTKTVNDGMPEKLSELAANTWIKVIIPIPEPLRGKGGFTLYRYHENLGGGEVQKITSVANADGEKIEVSPDSTYLTATLKKFSSYALGAKSLFTVSFMLDETTVFVKQSVAENEKATAPSPAPEKEWLSIGGLV